MGVTLRKQLQLNCTYFWTSNNWLSHFPLQLHRFRTKRLIKSFSGRYRKSNRCWCCSFSFPITHFKTLLTVWHAFLCLKQGIWKDIILIHQSINKIIGKLNEEKNRTGWTQFWHLNTIIWLQLRVSRFKRS